MSSATVTTALRRPNVSRHVRSLVRVTEIFFRNEVDGEVTRETGREGSSARSEKANQKELPVAPEHLFAALDSEWQQLANAADSTQRLRRWATQDRALGAFPDLPTLISYVQRRNEPVASDRVLLALLRLAPHDKLAARTVLQALVPGLRVVAITSSWAGEPEEVDAMVVASAWERIRRYPVDQRPERVAANILFDVLKQLCRERRRQLRAEGAEERAAVTEDPAVRSSAEQLLNLLNSAVAAGELTAADASLVAATRIGGVKIKDLAPDYGLTVRWLRKRRRRAEATLERVSP